MSAPLHDSHRPLRGSHRILHTNPLSGLPGRDSATREARGAGRSSAGGYLEYSGELLDKDSARSSIERHPQGLPTGLFQPPRERMAALGRSLRELSPLEAKLSGTLPLKAG
jgi:hypothetical protein